MTAPIASGRSDLAGWVSHPLVKRRLSTAHTHSGQSKICISTSISFRGKHYRLIIIYGIMRIISFTRGLVRLYYYE
jgi:hypothetical protein